MKNGQAIELIAILLQKASRPAEHEYRPPVTICVRAGQEAIGGEGVLFESFRIRPNHSNMSLSCMVVLKDMFWNIPVQSATIQFRFVGRIVGTA